MIANLTVLALFIPSKAAASFPTSTKVGEITVHHYVDTGVNFLYYVLSRTNLRIAPFAGYNNAYVEFHQKYGNIDIDWGSLPRVRDVWWDWLWNASFDGPYESAQQTMAHIHPKEGDAEWNAAVEKLKSVAESLMPDYEQHWKRIQAEVNAIVESMLESFPTEEILKRNEEIMRRPYEPAEAFFYYNFLRTTTAQSWEKNGDAIYIVGLDYLRDAKGFACFMVHELRHILINQSSVFGREDIQSLIQQIHSLTKDWKDSSETGCVIENMNFVLDAWYESGIDFDFSEFSRKQSRSGRRNEDILIAKAFYDNRQILAKGSFEKFVEASLKQLVAYGRDVEGIQKTIEWQIKTSYTAELSNFLWSIGKGHDSNQAYEKEKAFWRGKLGDAVASKVDEFIDFHKTGMSQSNLGTILHFSDAASLDEVIAALDDLKKLKSRMLRTKPKDLGWIDSIFIHLEKHKPLFQEILETLKQADYDEYWRGEILPVVDQQCEKLRGQLSNYSVERILREINNLLGPQYQLTYSPKPVYLTYFGYSLAYRILDSSSVHSFKFDRPVEVGMFVSTFIHELLHNYDPTEPVRDHLNRFSESQFIARNREMIRYYWGEGIYEDFIVAAEKYISVKLGVVSDDRAFHHLYTNYGGTSVLGVIVYDNMTPERLKGKTYNEFLFALFDEGVIQPATLESEYYRILEKRVGKEETEKRREYYRNAYARYKAKEIDI